MADTASVGILGQESGLLVSRASPSPKDDYGIHGGPVLSPAAGNVRNRDDADLDDEDPSQQLMKCTQTILSKACKRRRMSSNGRKAVLVARLRETGVQTSQEAERLASDFEASGVVEVPPVCRAKAPN